MSNAGRPPVFKDPEELEKKIQEYLTICKEEKTPYTITGLCYHCGFESRQSFYDYADKKEFSYTIKRARLAIEMSYEQRLLGNAVAGAIFALKNLGWKDNQELSIKNDNLPFSVEISHREKTDISK